MTKPTPQEVPTETNTKDRSVDDIIADGKRSRPGRSMSVILFTLSAVLLYASFTPIDCGPLAWVALVPMLLVIRVPQSTSWMLRNALLVGFLYWITTLQWMRLGDISMYGALLAMSIYMASYWVLFIWLTRHSVHRFHTPLLITAPVIWVGLEYLRAHMFTGFSWYYLGHTQHRWIEMIQISDIFGGYSVSFVIVLANAAIAQLIPIQLLEAFGLCYPDESQELQQRTTFRSTATGVVVSLLVIGATLGYGYSRRSQAAFVAGPRVGLIQGNFVASLNPNDNSPDEIFRMHRHLTGLTVPYQPDLILWPEAMYPYSMFVHEEGMTDEQLDAVHPEVTSKRWRFKNTQEQLAAMADESNAALVIGISVFSAKPELFEVFNSAVFVQPKSGIKDRYNKIHRVPFGEYIPLKEQLPFIQSLTPFRGQFGINAGDSIHVFKHKEWRFVPVICFEDTVPHLVRDMVKQVGQDSESGVDCLVNLTNDGWFHGSSELDQHLICAKFRCIETRTPMVRAVNTGISAIIDGDGVVRDPDQFIDFDSIRAKKVERKHYRNPKTGRYLKQLNCGLVGDVPLDPRTSLYVSWGDWFGIACLVACVATFLQSLTFRRQPTPIQE